MTDSDGEPVAGRRRALLVGVGRTAFLERDPGLAARFPRLGFVDRDVETVGAALAESGYAVESLHPRHSLSERQDTSVGSIVSAVEEFFLSCGAGDTAFLYFSGHGMSVGEREYLVASDARPRADGSLIAQTVLETAPEVLLGRIPEGVEVVVCLDTCRTDQPPSAAIPHETPLVDSAYRDVAWLLACGRGQAAYADPEKGSHFGIALSEALSRNSPPKTFKEVHAFVRGRVERLTARLAEPPPTVGSRCPEGLAERLVVCRGSQETQRWTEAVTGSALWRHTSHGPDVHERVKDRLADLAREVAKSRLGTDSALATPWSDPEYPIRFVERLDHLVEAAALTGRELLSPAETAALLAAPLLHEGVVAVALSELAALRPDRIDRREDGRGRDAVTSHDRLVCDAARDVARAHSQVGLAAETLRQRHLPERAAAADHWLRHRFIADWDRLWDRTGDYPAVDHLLDMVVTAVAAGAPGEPTPQNRTLIDRQVRQVLAHVTVAPGSSPRINDSGELRWSTHPAVPGNTWRGPDLAYLVWLAALLAADPRRMSSVLVDHLGAHKRLVPSDVVVALAEYRLQSPDAHARTQAGGTYDLAIDFLCPHPALHAAVEELAATADASVRALHKKWKETRTDAPYLLRGIPRKVTTEFLEPLDHQYTKPLERFRLAEDEIRPLLMGTQLYGDKMLAVRELYQNALDACRHRQLRVDYGRRLGKCGTAGKEPWIEFVQGYDEEDRPYIECRDTGTGMSRKKLTSMFARAGKRYEQDPDFVQERRNWRRAGIDPTPFNSRFGIGVFSYFMLAEEVVVTTATTDLHGNPSRTEAPLRATIQSGSGLLEIVETSDAPERGGTTVRLYLSADGETPPSLVETLRKLLWVSDHRVTAVELDRGGNPARSAKWTPGQLQASEVWPTAPAGAGTDAWLVQGKGQLLLDGVVVKNAPEVDGYVFNLRERDQPVPTVDRNGLIGWDEKGVMQRLLLGVPEAAGAFEEVSLRWLWDLADREPKLAVAVFDSLGDDVTGTLQVSYTEHSLVSSTLPAREVGCLPSDRRLILRNHLGPPFVRARRDEGILFQRWRGSLLGVFKDVREPFLPPGYPSPVGLDALLFERGVPDDSWTAALRAAALTEQSLAAAVRAQRRFSVTGVRVPEALDVRALRDVVPTAIMADLHTAYSDTRRFHDGGRNPAPARLAPLLPVAAAHGITLAEVLVSARKLVDSVPVPGWEELPRFPERTVSEMEAVELAVPLDAVTKREAHPWHAGTVHAVDLLVRAPSVEQRARLVQRIEELGELGFTLGQDVSDATLAHRPLTGDELRLLSYNTNNTRSWITSDLTLPDVLRKSQQMGVPVGRVVEQINALASATNVSAPLVPEATTDWTVPYWVGELLLQEEELIPLGPWSTASAMRRASIDAGFASLRQDLLHLDACGVLAPGCLALIEPNIDRIVDPPPIVERLFDAIRSHPTSAKWSWNLDTQGLGVELLTYLAVLERSTIHTQIEQLTALAPPLPLEVARLPNLLGTLPFGFEILALFEMDEQHFIKLSFRTVLSCKALLQFAEQSGRGLGDAVRTALVFRPVGGPSLPGPFTGPDAEALEDFAPTNFDLVAFDPGLLGPGALGPLDLVLVAGRFGWTLAKTYERYAPFRCLGLDVTTPEPVGDERDLVPDWRDVIVLTARLTGRAPALEGAVDPDHIVLCAEETDLTEEQVLDRLRRYARLFGLDLPATVPGGSRP
ncbi:caspase family protein [Streptomyces sp. NPDC012825]|uniref:HD domain-containing protein n=1 Tax=Streptomyces sp. NPDC012825 TaxID=3364851 RepID=UPI0036CBABED